MRRILLTFLTFLGALTALLIAPAHYILYEIIGYSLPTGVWRVLLSAAAAVLSGYLFFVTVGVMSSLYFQLRIFGREFFTNIPEILSIKSRSLYPYSVLSSFSKAKPPKRTFSLIGLPLYSLLAVSMLGFGLGRESESASQAVAVLGGLIFLMFFVATFFVHGRSPAILLLGVSSESTLTFQNKLQSVFRTIGATSLLNNLDEPDISARHTLLGMHFRAGGSDEPDWKESIRSLLRLSKVVIVDARRTTASLKEELEWIAELGVQNRCIFLASESFLPSDTGHGISVRHTEAGTIALALSKFPLGRRFRSRLARQRRW